MKSPVCIRRILTACLAAVLLFTAGCSRNKLIGGDPAYVSAPQANLRDRLSAVYTKAGVVKNGERVEILEKSKRFVRVRSPRGEEGWMEARNLVGPEVADAFEKIQKENADAPVQGRGVTHAELKMHVTPGRNTDALYRMPEGARVEILKRATAEKPQAPGVAVPVAPVPKLVKREGKSDAATRQAKVEGAANSAGADAPAAPAPVLEDWWLVRDAERHTGWVLARMIDIDVPLEVAQYAEGQRIVACFPLSQVTDVNAETGETKQVWQYVMALNQTKEGTPWDFNQVRVFTWNSNRHRYETAYREREIAGMLPLTIGHEVFPNEGDLPTFVVRVYDQSRVIEKKFKLNQPIVRRVLSPEEQRIEDQKKAQRLAELKQQREARRAARPAKPRKRR